MSLNKFGPAHCQHAIGVPPVKMDAGAEFANFLTYLVRVKCLLNSAELFSLKLLQYIWLVTRGVRSLKVQAYHSVTAAANLFFYQPL